MVRLTLLEGCSNFETLPVVKQGIRKLLQSIALSQLVPGGSLARRVLNGSAGLGSLWWVWQLLLLPGLLCASLL